MASNKGTAFKPIRGTEEKIFAIPCSANTEGQIYFATDTGSVYMDYHGKRISIGGHGVAVFYANEAAVQNSADDYYSISRDSVVDPQSAIKVDDLIMNTKDGGFYRVDELTEDFISCERIAVSGSGGGGGTGDGTGGGVVTQRGRLTVVNTGETDLLNGSDCIFSISATSATEDGVAIDDTLKLTIEYFVAGSSVPYYTDTMMIEHGQTVDYEATSFLRNSTETNIAFTLSGSESNKFYSNGKVERIIITHSLSLEWVASQFSNIKYFTETIGTSMRFSTGAKRILDVYFDDALVFTKTYLASDTTSSAAPDITKNSVIYNPDGSSTGTTLDGLYSHGRHTISAVLSLAKANGDRGSSTDVIKKEIALYLDEGYPLIWFGDMKEVYYEFDNPLVPIRVYDPHADSEGVKVYLFADGADVLDGEYYTISNDANNYLYWTLTNITAGQNIAYQVRIGEDRYETWANVPEFQVLEDPRKMGVAQQALTVNFDSRGRSNAESAKRRASIAIGEDSAKLEGFNWYNNGWVMDDDNTTCLRISNGATVTIPIKAMSFAGSIPSHSIEMRMKIRNVQSYEKLITNYTRYVVSSDPKVEISPTTDKNWNDNAVFEEFLAQRATGVASYDAYLTKRLPQLREADGGKTPTYEELGFSHLYRDYDLGSAMVKYIANAENPASESAICLGPQDGYFSNGTNAVTVDYVEDQIINLTIVYDNGTGANALGNNKLMKFYLNGMLTSVARSTVNGSWGINTPNLVIDSAGCDIDLYKFRVYDRALGLNEVLKNVAYDDKDTVAWDLAELYTSNQTINEDYQFSFNKMIDYNKNHPDDQLMPYILFTTDEENNTQGRLPWSKSVPTYGTMEFVNPALDRAYAIGELSQKADEMKQEQKDAAADKGMSDVEYYYLHHCPSFIAEGVEFSVQGTSSEFYPRRNYKAKTKVKVEELDENGSPLVDEFGDVKKKSVYTMKLHQGPFKETYEKGEAKTQKKWYYDNYTVGTDRWTLKIDYMESSGSYNMGLANLVNTIYSHHPLRDYNGANAFVVGTPGKETHITSFPANGEVWYRNHKGNWKIAMTGDLAKDAANEAKYGDVIGDITVTASNFADGPFAIAKAQNQSKVLGGTKSKLPDISDTAAIQANIEATSENGPYDSLKDYINKFYSYVPGSLTKTTIGNLDDYRTSVQGIPTLAFHQTIQQKAAGIEPLFIGRYNMLLDKGSDDAYGFTVDAQQAFVEGNPAIEDACECWEFQNNSRGFCSFRDPWNRRELSFASPEGASNGLTAKGAPLVADYFEYRYNAQEDYIDMFYDMNKSFESDVTLAKLKKQYPGKISDIESGRKVFLDLHKNWEEAVAWVWSTATDAVIDGLGPVPVLGTYEVIDVYQALFAPNTYYIETVGGAYTLADTYSEGITYYIKGTETDDEGASHVVYNGIRVTDNKDLVYEPSKYYFLQNGKYVLAESDYDASVTYYKLSQDTSKIDQGWKLAQPVTYGNTTYEYDTQEYRIAKFKNELSTYFNIEYLAAYFVITEVLECYDSRGKNAMFASWGPQKENGPYVWYPIFYDMDTQLGINNTGIPSFEYNVDATEDGTFSTNDSVLWNNFYLAFKNLIIDKYEQLTGVPSTTFGGKLNDPPFVSVDKIESWYSCDPAFTKTYSMMGRRPLLALNLDQQYKYISITNAKVGYMYQNGDITQDTSNTYFYALQGNRSMSRRQFLTNRLNYIDSWFTVGNYKRGGANRIRSRISANNSSLTSDKWIEGTAINGDTGLQTNVPYYDAQGKKTHLFDGEYWITMTPVRKMYVTVGTDAANFDPLKYAGTPVRFETSDLEIGVRGSGNYREQLYYIYGLDQMKSLGDLSRLYFQEFELSGKASKMTDLKLGYDGLDEEGNEYKNSGVNDWTIPAAAGTLTGGMPLLKEVNLCNVTFKNQNNTFDFSSCEKMTNFRNTGSNITQVTFADGVALDTLYLTNTTTALKLTEARKLTDLITEYEHPVADEDGNLVANKGLYIAGLTDKSKDEAKTNITAFDIQGGALGYNSYKLLDLYYSACMNTAAGTERKVNLTNVQWAPYVKITDAEQVYDAKAQYFVDNGHFGLAPYEYNFSTWKQYINNGIMYEYDASLYLKNDDGSNFDITTPDLFTQLISNTKFISTADTNNEIPNITGVVYIKNTSEIDEGLIQTELAVKFPGLTFFFEKVKKGYSARFVLVGADGGETLIGTDKISRETYESAAENAKPFFTNPFDRTSETAFSSTRINSLRPTQDFLGWGQENKRAGLVETYDAIFVDLLGNTAIHKWNTLKIDPAVEDYTFYAVFEDHNWDVDFYIVNDDGSTTKVHHYTVVHGKSLYDPGLLLSRDETDLADDKRYKFLGYSRKINGNNVVSSPASAVVDLTTFKATNKFEFYAVFYEESVFDSPTDLSYFEFRSTGYSDAYDNSFSVANKGGWQISPKSGVKLSGKVTLPTEYEGLPVIAVTGFGFQGDMSASSVAQPDVTHIYWYGTPQVRRIVSNGQASAFGMCAKLKYFQLPESLRVIGVRAFTNCAALQPLDFTESPNLVTIDDYAFTAAFDRNSATVSEFVLPGSLRGVGSYAIGNTGLDIDTLIFGGVGDPTQIQNLGSDDITWAITYSTGGDRVINKVRVYAEGGMLTERQAFLFDMNNNRVKRETSAYEVLQA